MLRCAHCGGHAVPALAHIHGLTDQLCLRCSNASVERQNQRMLEERLVAAALRYETARYLRELARSGKPGDFGDFEYRHGSDDTLQAA